MNSKIKISKLINLFESRVLFKKNEDLKKDKEVVLAAIKQNGHALNYAHDGNLKRIFRHVDSSVEAFEPEEIGVESLLREIKSINLNSLS